jgi:prolipoprotein diacylglyceryltransferase
MNNTLVAGEWLDEYRGYIYLFLLSIALILGMWLTESRCINRNLARKLYILGVIGGIFGARVFFSWMHGWDSAGLSSYGFALGAILSFSSVYYWIHGEWADTDFLDAVAPAIALGIAILRFGCFLNGCCFGSICQMPWCITYESGSSAYAFQAQAGLISHTNPVSLPVHPVQLYESGVCLIGFILLLTLPGIQTSIGAGLSKKLRMIEIQRYDLFLGWIVYYGIWRTVSAPWRAGFTYQLTMEQIIWPTSAIVALLILIRIRT